MLGVDCVVMVSGQIVMPVFLKQLPTLVKFSTIFRSFFNNFLLSTANTVSKFCKWDSGLISIYYIWSRGTLTISFQAF